MEQQPQKGPAMPAIIPVGTTALGVFSSAESFALGQRMAQALASSELVPPMYRNNVGNCLVAIEMANRVGASVLMVCQNLNIIHGRPSWSSPFIIAALNSCGMFEPLEFQYKDLGSKEVKYHVWVGPQGNKRKEARTLTVPNAECRASAIRKSDGVVLTGPKVTVEMAVKEGWWDRDGSKWENMAELMLTYRAAAFFGRLYAPHVLMGMHTDHEVQDAIDVTPEVVVEQPKGQGGLDSLNQRAQQQPRRKRGQAEAPPASPAAAAEPPPAGALQRLFKLPDGTPLVGAPPADAQVDQVLNVAGVDYVVTAVEADAVHVKKKDLF